MSLLRQRVAEVFANESATPLSRWVNATIMLLIVANVAAMVLETVDSIAQVVGPLFYWFEIASIAVFTLEYVARMWSCVEMERYKHPVLGRARYGVTPLALVDLLAIAPFYLPFLGVDLRIARSLRLMRIFRLAKLTRYSTAIQTLLRVLHKTREELTVTLSVLGILLLLAATVMYYCEHAVQPEAFASIPDAMWWGMATLSTVGYGDIYPITVFGRIAGGLIAVLGIGMFALPTGILGAAFVDEIQQRRQAASDQQPTASMCPHCGKTIEPAPTETRIAR